MGGFGPRQRSAGWSGAQAAPRLGYDPVSALSATSSSPRRGADRTWRSNRGGGKGLGLGRGFNEEGGKP